MTNQFLLVVEIDCSRFFDCFLAETKLRYGDDYDDYDNHNDDNQLNRPSSCRRQCHS